MRSRWTSALPMPVFEAEGGSEGGGRRNSFSADFVAKMTSDMDRLKEDLAAAKASHAEAVKALKTEHAEALKAAQTESAAALAAAQAAHAEALTAAKAEADTALTAAQTAAQQRMVGLALRAEAASAGLLDMDALKLVDPAEIEKLTVNDAGVVAGTKPLMEGLKKAKPFLFGQGSTSNPTQPPPKLQPVVKHARDMTDAEFAEANVRKAWRGTAAA